MDAQPTEALEARSFGILGISEAEERVYRWLLDHPAATIAQVAQAQSQTPNKAQRWVEALECKGLATHSPERPRRYVPSAPDVAMEALIRQRQNDLERARRAALELHERSIASRMQDEHEQMVELITSPEAERQIFRQIQDGAVDEVVALVKLPMRITQPAKAEDYEPQGSAQARGVNYRTINDTKFLSSPSAMTRVRQDIEKGEKVRVLPSLPFKMLLADHRIALIPLNLRRSNSPVLLVRSSALLDALYALFEMLWERATPITLKNNEAVEFCDSDLSVSEEINSLVQLLAVGLNDKTIAGELEISMRTLTRRIFDLMQDLGARTRFQAGWIAALRLSDPRR